MTQEKERTVKMVISIDIKTTKPIDDIKRVLERGIYRGLDTEPNYIAPPKAVNINYCQEISNKKQLFAVVENERASEFPDGKKLIRVYEIVSLTSLELVYEIETVMEESSLDKIELAISGTKYEGAEIHFI